MINDPGLNSLTETQLLFENESLRIQEEEEVKKVEVFSDVIKKAIIRYLGLNVMPIQDPETGKLRRPEDDEVIPLSILLANETILSEIMKKNKDLSVQEDVENSIEEEQFNGTEMTPEEIDEFMNEGSDLQFIDDPEEMKKYMIWNSEETKIALDSLVTPAEEIEEEDPYEEIEKAKSTRRRRVVVDD